MIMCVLSWKENLVSFWVENIKYCWFVTATFVEITETIRLLAPVFVWAIVNYFLENSIKGACANFQRVSTARYKPALLPPQLFIQGVSMIRKEELREVGVTQLSFRREASTSRS